MSRTLTTSKGFTLVELLVAIAIIAVLSTLGIMGVGTYRKIAQRSVCSTNLRQLSAATNLYLADSNGFFPAYVQNGPNGQRTWFFGNETTPAGMPEGKRRLDREAGPLYPYIQAVGKIEVCPSFDYSAALYKPKFKGASYGYGYNWILGGRFGGNPLHVANIRSSSTVILFGDCGQVNTFQKPATAKKPMLEEFYLINETDSTIHFRHNGKANILFVDGHIEVFSPYGTPDNRIKGETVGRITKKGSTEYLQ